MNKAGGAGLEILFLPDFSSGNPYQQELKTALERDGVSVKIGQGSGRFPLLQETLNHPSSSILHLHWLHIYWVRERFLQSLVHALRLIFELVYAKRRGTALVWTIHNLYEHENQFPKLESMLKRIMMNLSDRIIVHSQSALQKIRNEFRFPDSMESKMHVISHGHYIDSYPNDIDQKKAREWLGISEQSETYLFFGSLRPYKGLRHLIKTFQGLSSPTLRMIIAGKPHWRFDAEPLRKLCAEDYRILTFFEFIPVNRVQNFMNAADCVVLPFAKIFTSGSAILAMSFGKALIVPRNEYLTELIPEEGAIFYDSNEGEHGLKRALMASRNRDLQSMGQKNFQAIKKQNWNQIARQTFQIYKKF